MEAAVEFPNPAVSAEKTSPAKAVEKIWEESP
jgi:hypothetical protein